MTAIRRAALVGLVLLTAATIWTAVGGHPTPPPPVAHLPSKPGGDTSVPVTTTPAPTPPPATTTAATATAATTTTGSGSWPSPGPAAVRAVQALAGVSSPETSSALLRPGVCQPTAVDVIAVNDSAAEVQVLCVEQVTVGGAPVAITVTYQVALRWHSGAWVPRSIQ